MTTFNTQSPTDQTEKIIDSLKNDITSLNFRVKKRDDKIASLDVMLNQIMESHGSQRRAYEDLEGKLEDILSSSCQEKN